MAGWNLFIDTATGELVSEGRGVPEELDRDRYEVRELPGRPDWQTQVWDEESRTVVNRPAPIMVDRLDEIEARFLANPDFAAVWGSLNTTRKQQLRTGLRSVLGDLLRTRRYRDESEAVELD